MIGKLKGAGYLVEETAKGANNNVVPVFRLRIDTIVWKLGDGNTVRADPIKRRSYRDIKLHPNKFFQTIYQVDLTDRKRLRAADHTGQLSMEKRQIHEEEFRADWYMDKSHHTLNENKIRTDSISALFCSPTMELGVDIGGLSVVHMRNVPPNVSNYIQRSGRAGRSGQGALVFTYCSSFSPHDRHYFKNQYELVAGVVQAPRIDPCNRDLLLTHLRALTLSVVGLPGLDSSDGTPASLMRLISDDQPKMPLLLKSKMDSRSVQ